MELKSKDLVLHFININRYENALGEVDKLLAIKPEEGYYLYLRGYCLYYLSKNREAEMFLKEAIKQGYSEEACYFMLGRVYEDMKNYVAAEKNYKIVLDINPKDAQTLAIYGHMLYINFKMRKGIELIEKALELAPNDSFVLHYAFYCYLSEKKPERLHKILESYIENGGSEIGSCIKIGYYEYEKENYKLAVENFRKAYLLDPTNKAILNTLVNAENMASPLYAPLRFFNKLSKNKFLYIFMLAVLLASRLLLIFILYMVCIKIISWYKRRGMGI